MVSFQTLNMMVDTNENTHCKKRTNSIFTHDETSFVMFLKLCLARPSWDRGNACCPQTKEILVFCIISSIHREKFNCKSDIFFCYFLEGWAFLSLNKWIATLYTVFTHYPEKMRDRREQRKVSELRNLHDNRAVLFSPNQQSSLPSPMPRFIFKKHMYVSRFKF